MYGRLYAAICERFDLDTMQIWDLAHHFERLGWGIGDLIAAPDEVLLQAKGFGPESLKRWRSRVPAPRPRRGENDDWRMHAAMVAGSGL